MKKIFTIMIMLIGLSAFGQENDDMYFNKNDRLLIKKEIIFEPVVYSVRESNPEYSAVIRQTKPSIATEYYIKNYSIKPKTNFSYHIIPYNSYNSFNYSYDPWYYGYYNRYLNPYYRSSYSYYNPFSYFNNFGYTNTNYKTKSSYEPKNVSYGKRPVRSEIVTVKERNNAQNKVIYYRKSSISSSGRVNNGYTERSNNNYNRTNSPAPVRSISRTNTSNTNSSRSNGRTRGRD